MSKFERNKRHLRKLQIYFFNVKKSAAEIHRLLVEAYNEAALSMRTLDAELEEDSSQTQKELTLTLGIIQQAVSHRLKSLGMIHKQGNWVPYELKSRDVERQLCTSEMLLSRHRKKGFYIESSLVMKSGYIMIIQKEENHGEYLATRQHRQQNRIFMEKTHGVTVKKYLKALDWEVVPHPPYSPDIAPSDYNLFRSLAHALSEQRFTSYEDTKPRVDSWIASKDKGVFQTWNPNAA
ncbi:Mariner Mos1 transposase [Eumeta japonica]|uniref:Mariner Mos1 transposase n=1 Tax=Eumeta variegata TaxID=151549 RepID=A0A4C1ZH91_EUMVA|nr:Mariner Mos1 transposase [Eumeta japonica]